ncbi:MAG: NifU family protein [Xanthomonadales bacterium]|nr:NifU family protein [Xanthomonadales bacterium]
MIEVYPSAKQYFSELLSQQDADDLGLRMLVSNPGTPGAECELSFCLPEDCADSDLIVDLDAFQLRIDADSVPFLEDAEIDFEENRTGGQLVVRAPNIRGSEPDDDSPLADRVRYILDSEINPSLASHGGMVSLVSIEEGTVVLQFGGGCHGCGMVNVTLKEGVEKTLKARLPEIQAVRDVTDHSTGENPYYS